MGVRRSLRIFALYSLFTTAVASATNGVFLSSFL